MPVPTHREDCKTYLNKTRCPDCGDNVFYFSCTCGSKVFFDLDVPPWNPHEHRCWLYHIRIMREIYGYPEHLIVNIIEQEANVRNIVVPPEIRAVLATMTNNLPSRKLRIIEIPPTDETKVTVGVITVVNRNINFFKKFDYPDNVMGRALLGKLANDAYLELTIREGANEENVCSEFICYMLLETYLALKIQHNAMVAVTLKPFQLPDGRFIWLIFELTIL